MTGTEGTINWIPILTSIPGFGTVLLAYLGWMKIVKPELDASRATNEKWIPVQAAINESNRATAELLSEAAQANRETATMNREIVQRLEVLRDAMATHHRSDQ